MPLKVAIIGGGQMGLALGQALIEKKVSRLEDLLILEKLAERVKQLEEILPGVKVIQNPSAELKATQVLVLAVKPQDYAQAANELAPIIQPEQLIFSVMTGINLERLAQDFADNQKNPHTQIVRTMPNLPMRIGKSMSVYIFHKNTQKNSRESAELILSSIGEKLEVQDQDLINAATAISGSGPGYLFYFAEQLKLAAEGLGFSESQAACLVSHTLEGAAQLLLTQPENPGRLKESVRSKGGTTNAAFEVFDRGGMPDLIQQAVNAAYSRARELK